MNVANTGLLSEMVAHVDDVTRSDIRSWTAEVRAAEWFSESDVLEQFPGAVDRGDGDWRFTLARSGLVIDAKIRFRNSQFIIRKVSQ